MTNLWIACGFSIGIGFIVYAWLLWGHISSHQKNNSNKSRTCTVAASLSIFTQRHYCAWTVFFIVIGCGLIIYTFLESAVIYKTQIITLINIVKGNDYKLVLGLLGIVMTITTAGVISLSRNALLDIREERKFIAANLDDVQNKTDPIPDQLKLQMQRLNLLYHNAEELKTTDEDIKPFRQPLSTYYSNTMIGSEEIIGFLEYLKSYYNRHLHGSLLQEERDYLQLLIKYHETYPTTEDDSTDHVNLSKKIINIANQVLRQ